MDLHSEFLGHLFKKEVLRDVELLKLSNEIIFPVSHEMTCRLYKVNQDTINFDYLGVLLPGYYFETIAVYKSNSLFLREDFYNYYLLNKSLYDCTQYLIQQFPLIESCMLACASFTIREAATERKDSKNFVNGILVDVFVADDGSINVFADDKYGLPSNKPLMIYRFDDGNIVTLIGNYYLELFQDLNDRQLISLNKLF